MNKPFVSILLLFPLIASCIVDKEMDLKKDIDKVVTVVPGMTVPFGDVGTIRTGAILNDIVQANKTVSWLAIVDFDPDGNFCFSTGSKTLKSVPLVEGDILPEEKTGVTLSGTPAFDASSSASVDLKTTLEWTGAPALTEGVEAVRNITTAPFSLDWALAIEAEGASSVTVRKGFRITLPGFLTVQSVPEGSRFAKDGEHALVSTQEFSLKPGETCPAALEVSATLDKTIQRGTDLSFSGDLLLSGGITATPGDGFSQTSPLTCRLSGQRAKAALAGAEVLLRGGIACNSIDTYPAAVNYANPYVNLSDLELTLEAENRADVPMDLSARLVGEDAYSQSLCNYPVGSPEGAAPVQIPAQGKASWLFAGSIQSEGFTPYLFPGLSQQVRESETSHFGFSNVRMTPREPYWQRVSADGGEGLFQGTGQFFMPFMIGKGVDSAIDFKFGHFQIDTTMTLDKLTPVLFQMDIENTTPLSFRFAAEIVDKDGKVVTDYNPIVEGIVKGGTVDSPGTSMLTVGFTTREIVPFDGIKLTFTVDSEADAGTPLNRYQGVSFKHMRLVTPEGLTFDPAWLKYVQYLMDVKRVVDDVIEIVDSFKE